MLDIEKTSLNVANFTMPFITTNSEVQTHPVVVLYTAFSCPSGQFKASSGLLQYDFETLLSMKILVIELQESHWFVQKIQL